MLAVHVAAAPEVLNVGAGQNQSSDGGNDPLTHVVKETVSPNGSYGQGEQADGAKGNGQTVFVTPTAEG